MKRNLMGLFTCVMMTSCTGAMSSVDNGGSASGPSEEVDGGTTPGFGPHLETSGRVVVEAENFVSADVDFFGSREWIVQAGAQAGPGPDPDGYHAGSSGDTYLELLPDTRVTSTDPFDAGTIFDNEVGGATVSYEIRFDTAGTYYVWVRAYSTGSEDNGLHVGIDGNLPDSGKRIQWCGTGQWRWSNAQRDSGGSSCGVNGTITIDVSASGEHIVTFYQREDGFEFDRFILTTDPNFEPGGAGPVESPRLLSP